MRSLSLLLIISSGLLAACHADAPEPTASAPATAEASATPAPAPPEPAAGKRAPGQEHTPLLAYRAFGTEPFWNVRVEGDTLVFSTPDDQQGRSLPASHEVEGEIWRFSGEQDGQSYRLSISPGACSDGMSDNTYALVSTFEFGETRYEGCAEAAK